jgi:chemotaxis protein methyltransferase CheR
VTFEMARADWKLTVSDNGSGRRERDDGSEPSGLGAVLVAALSKQLKAQIFEKSSTEGLEIAIARATFQPTTGRAEAAHA